MSLILLYLLWLLGATAAYAAVLITHALRNRYTLAPLYICLGFLASAMMWLSTRGATMSMGELQILWGSTTFSSLLVALFVIYVFDGTQAARLAVATVGWVVLASFLMEYSLYLMVEQGVSQTSVPVRPPNARVYFASVFAGAVDLAIVAVLWETLRRKIPSIAFCIFSSLVLALALDSLIFPLVAFGGTHIWSKLSAGALMDRLILVAWVTPVLTVYFKWQEKKYGGDLGRGQIFSILKKSAESEKRLFLAEEEIRERRKIEARLRESEEQFRRLVENIPGVTFRIKANPERELVYASNNLSDLTGRPVEPGEPLAFLIHPEDRQSVLSLQEASLSGEENYTCDYRVRAPDGTIRHVEERGQVFPDGTGGHWIDGVLTDNTEWHQIEQARLKEERRFRAVFEQSRLIKVMISPDGKVLDLNRDQWLGKTREDLLGESWLDLAKPLGQAETAEKALQQGLEGQVSRFESSALDYKGRRHVYEVTVMPIRDGEGDLELLLILAYDITELRQVQQELREAKAEADSANQAKSDFLATMSHEIRTPMNAIIGMTHLMQRTELSRKQRDYAQKIATSAHSLLGIINDILDFSKIEAGKLTIEKIPFELDSVLEQLGQLLAVKASEKDHLEVLLRVDPKAPRSLKGDPLRLSQVLINLGGNAVKFTESGEVLVSVNLVDSGNKNVQLKFSVTDTGIGLSEDQQAKLFTPFNQADTSTTRKFGGTGLGLSICRRLVELMGGDIGLESVEGKGSTFHFTLPFEIAETKRKAVVTPGLSDLKVLVVDDNAHSREIMETMLLGFGYEVALAPTGEEALTDLKTGKFDLVLMDWKMPGLNGVETVRRLTELELEKKPSVILVTAYGREDVSRSAEEVGIEQILLKPLNESTLLDAIADAFAETGETVEESEDSFPTFRPTTILLAEDNIINQQVACEILQLANLQVLVAGNGEEALKLAAEEDVTLVLMDVRMPVLDGLEATRKLRARGFKKPIVAMTAEALVGDREKCLEAGMDDYVSKPIDPHRLFSVLETFLRVEGRSHTQTAPSADLPELDDLDTESALKRIGGNKKLYGRLLLEFREEQAEAAHRLKAHLEEGETQEALHLAHTLKGVGANLGMTAVFEHAKDVETALREKREPGECLEKLEHHLRIVVHALEGWEPAQDEPKKAIALDKQDLANRLQHLEPLFESDLGEAMELVDLLVEELRGSEVGAHLERLHQSLMEFDTDTALEVTGELLGKLKGT